MIFALSQMDPTVRGILFLVAVVLFVVAAVVAHSAGAFWATLVAAGLAFASFVWMWDAFSAS
jgi:hypothetical protein